VYGCNNNNNNNNTKKRKRKIRRRRRRRKRRRRRIDSKKSYEYLGIEESFDIQHKNEKEKLEKEYLRRLRLVLGTELSAKNKIQATGSLATPVLRYSFGIFT